MEENGTEQVDKAFNKVSYHSPDNPKRSYKYVVGILQTEAKERYFLSYSHLFRVSLDELVGRKHNFLSGWEFYGIFS